MKKATRMGGFFHARPSGTSPASLGDHNEVAPHHRHVCSTTDGPVNEKCAPVSTQLCSPAAHPSMPPSLGGHL